MTSFEIHTLVVFLVLLYYTPLRNFVIEGVACQRRLQATPQLQTSLIPHPIEMEKVA